MLRRVMMVNNVTTILSHHLVFTRLSLRESACFKQIFLIGTESQFLGATRFHAMEQYISENRPENGVLDERSLFWVFSVAPTIVYPSRILDGIPCYQCVFCGQRTAQPEEMKLHYERLHDDQMPKTQPLTNAHHYSDLESNTEQHPLMWRAILRHNFVDDESWL